MTRDAEHTPSPQSVVTVEVSGLTGSGKSAVMGEIEIALKALGLTVEHDAAFQAEKNGTHADWQEALDLYRPTVVLTERNVSRAPAPGVDAVLASRVAATMAALTPRHEAPADHHERNLTASNAELIEQALSHPPLEAPAEGAGEAYASARAEIETLLMGETFFSFAEASELATDVMEIVSKHFLRARSSAPEALGNLLAVIHRDGGQRTLVVGVEQAAAEAEKIVARLLSSAPEAREREAVGVVYSLKADLNTAELPDGTLLYTHPAHPSADKLRIGLDEIERLVNQSGAIPKGELRSILAALKAEV